MIPVSLPLTERHAPPEAMAARACAMALEAVWGTTGAWRGVHGAVQGPDGVCVPVESAGTPGAAPVALQYRRVGPVSFEIEGVRIGAQTVPLPGFRDMILSLWPTQAAMADAWRERETKLRAEHEARLRMVNEEAERLASQVATLREKLQLTYHRIAELVTQLSAKEPGA